MKRENAKKWAKEIAFWANGGTLWGFTPEEGWFEYTDALVFNEDIYVMADKHLRARKAFALGEPIEYNMEASNLGWSPVLSPIWYNHLIYRPKPKEWDYNIPKDGILCWCWDIDCLPKFTSVILEKNKDWGYLASDGFSWKFATPIKPEECYQGAKGDN